LDTEHIANFTLIIQARDSGLGQLTSQILVEIAVDDVNEAPQIDKLNSALYVAENSDIGSPVGTPIGASDPEGSDQLLYSITSQSDPGAFQIDESTGQVSTAKVLNYEEIKRHSLVVRVEDDGVPQQATTFAINVQLLNRNDEPSMESQIFSVLENAVGGTKIGAPIVATDPDQGNGTFVFSLAETTCFSINTLSTYDMKEISRDDESIFANDITFRTSIYASENGVIELSNSAGTASYRINIGADGNKNTILEKCLKLSKHNEVCSEIINKETPNILNGLSQSKNIYIQWNEEDGLNVYHIHDSSMSSGTYLKDNEENLQSILSYKPLTPSESICSAGNDDGSSNNKDILIDFDASCYDEDAKQWINKGTLTSFNPIDTRNLKYNPQQGGSFYFNNIYKKVNYNIGPRKNPEITFEVFFSFKKQGK
jgi:hypothetical protein